MAQRQTHMAQAARSELRAGPQAERKRQAQRREHGETRAERYARHDRSTQARLAAFYSLQKGDSLAPFALAATVAKKNAKSVVTDNGVWWTRFELTGVQ